MQPQEMMAPYVSGSNSCSDRHTAVGPGEQGNTGEGRDGAPCKCCGVIPVIMQRWAQKIHRLQAQGWVWFQVSANVWLRVHSLAYIACLEAILGPCGDFAALQFPSTDLKLCPFPCFCCQASSLRHGKFITERSGSVASQVDKRWAATLCASWPHTTATAKLKTS